MDTSIQKMIKHLCIVFLVCIFSNLSAQSAHASLRDGDEYYQKEDFASAELSYRKANEKDPTLKSTFNLGNSLYSQERYEEAIDYYQSAVQRAQAGEESSNAYYNLGNAYFNHQDLEQAISAFKRSVLENPNNKEAQYNLIVCKEILKQQQQQQQQQCNNPSQDQNQDNKEQQDQEDQQSQEEQQQNGEQQDQEEQKDQEEQQQEEEQQDSSQINNGEGTAFDSSRLEKQSLDSIDAAKLLQIIESEEQKVQEKLRKFNSKRKKQEKDW